MNVNQPELSLPLPRGVTEGQKFNSLTIVQRVSNDSHKRIRLLCRCECGQERIARLADLRSGHTKSCGCLKAKNLRHRFGKVQLVQFCGHLIPLGTAEGTRNITASTVWMVGCVFCPRIISATTRQLRSGKRHCPCLEKTYSSWRNAIQRTTNKNHEQYATNYKDVSMCESWRRNFSQFVQDMGRRPEGKSLDRWPNPKGNYEPGNCRWATPEEQAENRDMPRKQP